MSSSSNLPSGLNALLRSIEPVKRNICIGANPGESLYINYFLQELDDEDISNFVDDEDPLFRLTLCDMYRENTGKTLEGIDLSDDEKTLDDILEKTFSEDISFDIGDEKTQGLFYRQSSFESNILASYLEKRVTNRNLKQALLSTSHPQEVKEIIVMDHYFKKRNSSHKLILKVDEYLSDKNKGFMDFLEDVALERKYKFKINELLNLEVKISKDNTQLNNIDPENIRKKDINKMKEVKSYLPEKIAFAEDMPERLIEKLEHKERYQKLLSQSKLILEKIDDVSSRVYSDNKDYVENLDISFSDDVYSDIKQIKNKSDRLNDVKETILRLDRDEDKLYAKIEAKQKSFEDIKVKLENVRGKITRAKSKCTKLDEMLQKYLSASRLNYISSNDVNLNLRYTEDAIKEASSLEFVDKKYLDYGVDKYYENVKLKATHIYDYITERIENGVEPIKKMYEDVETQLSHYDVKKGKKRFPSKRRLNHLKKYLEQADRLSGYYSNLDYVKENKLL